MTQSDFNIRVFFWGGGGEGVFVAAIFFKSFFLKINMVTSIFLNIFVQDGSFLYVVANNRHKLNKFILEKVIIKKHSSLTNKISDMWQQHLSLTHLKKIGYLNIQRFCNSIFENLKLVKIH